MDVRVQSRALLYLVVLTTVLEVRYMITLTGIYAAEKLVTYYNDDLLKVKKELDIDYFRLEVLDVADEVAARIRYSAFSVR